MVNYALEAWHSGFDDPIWLPAWLAAPFVGGLIYHILVARAVGIPAGSGWYLNILAPPLAVAIGYGMARASRNRGQRIILRLSLCFTVFFLLAVLWAQMALFSGCAAKDHQKYYEFTGHAFCLNQVDTVAAHLSVLGWPVIGLTCFGIGFLCLTVGLVAFFQAERSFRKSTNG
jgi:hypothetical protein